MEGTIKILALPLDERTAISGVLRGGNHAVIQVATGVRWLP